MDPRAGGADLDPHLLLWDIHRNIDVEAVPDGRTVIAFLFPELATARRWWIVISADGVDVCDVCDVEPDFPVRVTVEPDLRTLTLLWRGDIDWAEAAGSGALVLHGEPQACRALPRWLKLSSVARTPRPARRPAVVA